VSTGKTCMLVFMRLSEKYAVPKELALLYDFANTLDCRRYVEQGVAHAGGDELASPQQLEAGCAATAWRSAAGTSTRRNIAGRSICVVPCVRSWNFLQPSEAIAPRRAGSARPSGIIR